MERFAACIACLLSCSVFGEVTQERHLCLIESRNVLIEDCDVDADDDALVFKSESDPAFDIFNVEVRNIDIRSGYQTPIFIRMERRHPPRDNDVPTCMRDILIENVKLALNAPDARPMIAREDAKILIEYTAK